MNIAKRDALVARLGTHVSLEDFFDGNDDRGSIWCNLEASPEPDEVYKVLLQIRQRDDVSDVRILITQFDGGEAEWPFSDSVLFVTSCGPKDVLSWLGALYAPQECVIDCDSADRKPSIPEGRSVVLAWWD